MGFLVVMEILFVLGVLLGSIKICDELVLPRNDQQERSRKHGA